MKKFWEGRRVLITGAAGFVGANAVSFFQKKKARITATVSPSSSDRKITINLGDELKNIKIIRANLLYPNEAEKASKGQDIILNFAAVDGNLSFKNKYSADLFSQNMRINLNMLEASKDAERFLLVGSSDIYADEAKSPITEKSTIGVSWEHTSDGYKLAKWVSELAAREFNKQFGTRVVMIRPSNLYGPRDDFENEEKIRFIPAAIKRILKDGRDITLWGDGKQVRAFLYVEDFLGMCAKLIEKDSHNFPINVANSKRVTLRQVAEGIIKIAGGPYKIMVDSSKPGGTEVRYFDTSLLNKLIGRAKTTSLNEGLRSTIRFYRDNYL